MREATALDIKKIVNYFLSSEPDFLKGMGADKSKMLQRDTWLEKLYEELKKPFNQKSYYYVTWLMNGHAIGHSNANNIVFGDSATMHLHLWHKKNRNKGFGLQCLKLTIPLYFKHLKLKTLICEPFSENTAPNKTLIKFGFERVRTYKTIPGPIHFRQTVHRYELRVGVLNKINNNAK